MIFVKRRGFFFKAALAALAFCTAATAGLAQAADTPQRGGVLVAAVGQEPKSYDPLYGDGGHLDQFAWRQVYESLVNLSPSGELEPGLATAWAYVDGGKAIEFELRPGVQFHDGTPFDAEAAAFNISRALDKSLNAPRQADFAGIAGVEVLAPLRLRVNLSEPSAAVLPALAYAGLMASPKAVAASGQDYGRKPVGTGPFRFVGWQSGNRIELARNPDYWRKDANGGDLPYLDGAVIRFVPNPAVRLIEAKSGNVQLIDAVEAQDVPQVEADPALSLVRADNGMLLFFSFNIAKPPFDDARLRQAVLYALDRQSLLAVAARGQGEVVPTVFPSSTWVYDASVDPYRPDAAKVRELLAEAGHPDGFKASLQIIQRQPDTLVAQLMQAQLKPYGIDLQIEVLERQVMQARQKSGDHQMAVGRLTVPDADPSQVTGRTFGRQAPILRTGVADEKLYALIDAARQETDQAQRKQRYRDVQAYLLDNALYGFLFYRDVPQVQRKTLHGLNRTIGGAWLFGDAWLAR